jgi:hypothetical protein
MNSKRPPNPSGAEEIDQKVEQLLAAATAIVAALLWPEDFKTGKAAEAILRAHKLIESVPDYLSGKKTSPGQSAEEAFQNYFRETDRRMPEAREWGLAEPWNPELYQKYKILPEGVFTFDRAIEQGFCHRHKTVHGLKRILRSVDYPEQLLRVGLITKIGYQRALAKQKAMRREADRARKKKKRSATARTKPDATAT